MKKAYCHLLDIREQCAGRRTIVVGDIHGCFDDFVALLEECNYSSEDVVVSVGDLVDRGPKIRETLLWFYGMSGAYVAMGNHDEKAVRYWNGNPVKIINGLDKTIEQVGDNQCEEIKTLARWISSFPHIIRVSDIDSKPTYVVHAGVDGRVKIESQRRETCLYARYVDGKDFFDSENGIPWWKTLKGDYTVVSGHIITDNVHPCESAYCIDGGAHEGGKLRALVIENGSCTVHEIDCGKLEERN